MPMREDCKHYESRTYPNGETVRKCDLDLAPEAPWRCPADCPSFTRRADVAWQVGSQVAPPPPREPASLAEGDDSVARLLDEAEEIINAAGPDILADLEKSKRKGRRGRRGRRRDR